MVRIGVVEHAAGHDACREQALDGLAILVEHAALGVDDETARGAQAVGELLGGVERRLIDGHHHGAGHVEVGVGAGGAHLVPVVDSLHEGVGGHFHELGQLFQGVGLEGVLALGSSYPLLLGPVAGRTRRPNLVDLGVQGAVHDVEIVGAGLVLDGHGQLAVRVVLRGEPLAELVHAHEGHELLGIEHDGLRELILGSADGHAHLKAVAGVAEGAGEPAARHAAGAAALLQHLLVELVAAGGQHDALGAVVLLIAVGALHDDAGHGARLVGHQLAGRGLVADLDAGLGEDAGEDIGQLTGRVGEIQRGVPRAAERRGVVLLAEVGEVAGGEGEGVVVEVLVVEVADVPVHGFAVLLEVVLVQRHVRLERAADHGV